jgi:hypothetical protein
LAGQCGGADRSEDSLSAVRDSSGEVGAAGGQGDVAIVPRTSEQFESALRRYKQAADKSWSLTDCASFEVMEEELIQAALVYAVTCAIALCYLIA